MRTDGVVYLVGAGPGDPGLITVRGMECLRRAEVLLYDYLAGERLLNAVPTDCEKIYVGKKAGCHSMQQEAICALLVEKAREGRRVVRLKGGDPFVFGRGGEEALVLAEAGVAFEVVPGVTSGIASPAFAGIPVTQRGSAASVAFVTGHEAPGKTESDIDWERLATAVDTLVIFMGVGNLPGIVKQLVANGRPGSTPAALVEWGTLPKQKTATGTLDSIVDEVATAGVKPPAIIVVGEVVALREHLQWFEKRPLFGKRVVVTRSRSQASRLSAWLAELGATTVECPTIEIEPVGESAELDRAVRNVSRYDWIIFTSVNGVRFFFDRFFQEGRDIRDLGTPRLGAIGPATADCLRDLHLRVDFVPSRFVAECFAEEFLQQCHPQGKRFLLPGSDKARDVIERAITEAGGEFDFVTLYRNVAVSGESPGFRAMVEGPSPDWVTFTSSSTARNFFAAWGGGRPGRMVSIGPITSAALREAGHEPDAEAVEHTIEGLVRALLEAEGKQV